MSHSENKIIDNQISSKLNSYNKEGLNDINNKSNTNHLFKFDASPNLFKKNNSYLKTNLDSIKNVPILSEDNFVDVFNEYNNSEKKNKTQSNDNNIENNKIIRLKLEIENINDITKNKEIIKEMNGYNNNKFDNLNGSKKFEILENGSGNKNNKYIISNNEENDKHIEVLNIQNNFQEDNSMNNNSKYIDNTINTFGDDDEKDKDKNYNFNFINNMNLDKNFNKNAIMVDIDTFSENRSNSPEANLYNNNSKEIKNNNFNTHINDNFPIPFKKQNSYSQFSPFHLPSNDSKKEIINSNSNNINFKDNYSSPDSNIISPIIKNLSNSDSNEVKTKINIINNITNNYENNISSFGKNSFKEILPLIQKKEIEYLEKFGSPKNFGGGKNFKIQKNINNNIIINKWKKFSNYLKKKNIDLIDDISSETKYIINSLLKNKNKNDDNNYNCGCDKSVEQQSETKIIAYTEVKELSNSNDNINNEDNNINNFNNIQLYERQENNKNWNNNIKEIYQNESNYEGTNINYINRLDFRKILDENKFTNLIEEIKEYEDIEIEKMKKQENELNNKNKKEMMFTINEEDDESKYDQDSMKESRKNSNFSRSKIIKNDEGIKIKNSSKNVSKNNSMNIEIYKNKNININDISDIVSGKNRNNYLSLSDNNIEINEKLSPKNRIDLSYNNNKEDKSISIYDENYINRNDIDINNLSGINKSDFIDNNIQNIEESKVIKNDKKIHSPIIDSKEINFNIQSIKDKLKEINQKYEEYSNKNVNNIDIELNSNKTKPHNLFQNILKNDKNNSDSDDSKKNCNVYILFNQPYQNSQFNLGVNENNFSNKNNSHNMSINNINVNLFTNNNNKTELNNDDKDKKGINLFINKSTQNTGNMEEFSNPFINNDKKKKSTDQMKLIEKNNQTQSQNYNQKKFDNNQTNTFFYSNNYLNNQNNVYNPFAIPKKDKNLNTNENEKDKDKENGDENKKENIIIDKNRQIKLNENEIHKNYNNKKDSGIINDKKDINCFTFENKEKLDNINMDGDFIKKEKKNDKEDKVDEENNKNEKINQIKDIINEQETLKIKKNTENNENNEKEAPIPISYNNSENNSTNINNHIKKNDNNNNEIEKENEYDFDLDDEDSYNLLNNKQNNDNKNIDINTNDIDNNSKNNDKNQDDDDIYFDPENHIFEKEDNNACNNKEEIINNEKSDDNDADIDNKNENKISNEKSNNIKINIDNNKVKLIDNKKSNNSEIHDNIQTTININNKSENNNDYNECENININNLNNDDNYSEGKSQERSEKIILNMSNSDINNDTSKYYKYIRSPKSYKDNEDYNESQKEENSDEEMVKNGNEIIFIEKKDNNKTLKYVSNEQINKLKNYIDYIVDLNDDEVNKNYLNYIILDKNKNNRILFTNKKNINNRNNIYSIPLSSYLLILNKISLKRKPIDKLVYESLIKKLIKLTNFHKQEIESQNNLIDSSNDISKDKNEELDLLFLNLKKAIEVLRDHYLFYLNNKKYNGKDEKDLKELENIVNIPQKRENLKNIYKDLIKFINNIYKHSPEKKINCYKKIIKYLKEYEKLNDGNTKERKIINRDIIDKRKSKLDIIIKDNKDNNNWHIVNKRFNLLMIIGGVVLPLCYLINFLNSNLK